MSGSPHRCRSYTLNCQGMDSYHRIERKCLQVVGCHRMLVWGNQCFRIDRLLRYRMRCCNYHRGDRLRHRRCTRLQYMNHWWCNCCRRCRVCWKGGQAGSQTRGGTPVDCIDRRQCINAGSRRRFVQCIELWCTHHLDCSPMLFGSQRTCRYRTPNCLGRGRCHRK